MCRHLNARIHGSDIIGRTVCPDCRKMIDIYEVFNGFMDEMAERMKELPRGKDIVSS